MTVLRKAKGEARQRVAILVYHETGLAFENVTIFLIRNGIWTNAYILLLTGKDLRIKIRVLFPLTITSMFIHIHAR